MKKKTGFTLAEVLITLAIIGIIAALVLPAVLNNFQFRAVGTRLSKFMTTVENSTRAYVETEGALDPVNDAQGITNYVRRTFSISRIDNGANITDQNGLYNMTAAVGAAALDPIASNMNADLVTAPNNQPNSAPGTPNEFNQPIILKDGTSMAIYPLNSGNQDWMPQNSPVPTTDAIGRPALGILFSPAANALPTAVRRTFGFVITDLGYVYPAPADGCTWTLYANRWQTRPDDFAAGTACSNSAALGAFPDNWQQGPRVINNNNNNNNNGG